MEPLKSPLEHIARLRVTINRAQADALEVRENGTIRVPVELFRAEKAPKTQEERKAWHGGIWQITKAFVENTFERWDRVPLVDSHQADWDAVSSHIGGFIEVDKIVGSQKAVMGFIETDDTPMGKQMSGLIIRHVEWVREGSRPVVTLSMDAVNVVPNEDVDFMNDEPPWPIDDGDPHHVMLVIAGMEGQSTAGIRATSEERIAEELEAYFGEKPPISASEVARIYGRASETEEDPDAEDETQRLMSRGQDDDTDAEASPKEPTMEPELEAQKLEIERLKQDGITAKAAHETLTSELEILKTERDALKEASENREKEELREEIRKTYAAIDEEPPKDLDEMDVTRLYAENLKALRQHRDTIAAAPGRSRRVSDQNAPPERGSRRAAVAQSAEDGSPLSLDIGDDEEAA